jgi:hypothetical protein
MNIVPTRNIRRLVFTCNCDVPCTHIRPVAEVAKLVAPYGRYMVREQDVLDAFSYSTDIYLYISGYYIAPIDKYLVNRPIHSAKALHVFLQKYPTTRSLIKGTTRYTTSAFANGYFDSAFYLIDAKFHIIEDDILSQPNLPRLLQYLEYECVPSSLEGRKARFVLLANASRFLVDWSPDTHHRAHPDIQATAECLYTLRCVPECIVGALPREICEEIVKFL